MKLRRSGWFRPAPQADFWLTCGVPGDVDQLHRHGMLLLMTEQGTEAVAVACELWRRAGLHENAAADLLLGGYAAWVPEPAKAPADAERFVRWVLDELDQAPSPDAPSVEDMPAAWVQPLVTRYRVQVWACTQLVALARAAGDDDRVRRAETLAHAVYAQMNPSLAPAAASAFLGAQPRSAVAEPQRVSAPAVDALPVPSSTSETSPSGITA
jgi:hypothetical protein